MRLLSLKSIAASTVLTASLAVSGAAFADDWAPSGPVRMMIGFGAGGATDSISRIMAQEISERRGWEIIPENVPGRGGVNMGVQLKDEPADGGSIGVGTDNALGYNRIAQKTPPFEVSDFTAITTITAAQPALVSRPDSGWKTFADLLAHMKAGNSVTAGVDADRIQDAMYVLAEANGVAFTFVKVDGGRAGMNAVVAGDIDVAFAGGAQAAAVEAGDLVELLNLGPVPLAGREDVLGMKDFGVTFTLGAMFTVTAPAGIPDEARKAWAEAIAEVANDETSQTYQLISGRFSGPDLIALDELDAHIEGLNAGAEALLEASAN